MADEKPFHLRGNYAPVSEEITAFDLPVQGAIPPELRGLYVRNGANPVTGTSPHWFLGQGMLHGVRLEAGRALWYRNRYVRTPYFEKPGIQRVSSDGKFDRIASAANTHVLAHAGKLLALEEGSFPWVVDGELGTVGYDDYRGKLTTAMTAHPKLCPVTGELHGFGYGQLPPFLVYHRISPDGHLVQSEEIAVGGPTMIHDFAITTRHVLFMDLPVVFDLALALKGSMPFHWSDDYPARIGVLPRGARGSEARWFEIEPCYVFHGLNAYDEGDRVVFDVCRLRDLWRDSSNRFAPSQISLHRFSFDLAGGSVKEETLDDRGMDFPRVADACVGRKHRFGYTLRFASEQNGVQTQAGLLKLDLERGASELHEFGAGCVPGEPVFVPAGGADPRSDEGYVLSFVHDENSERTQLVVLDASSFTAPPLARIALPQRVPYGFHGSWIADPA
jgi:carotenoid cleavage dioxygenase-like enzyme